MAFSKELEKVLKQDKEAKHEYFDNQIRQALEETTSSQLDRKAAGEALKNAAEKVK